MKSKKYIFLNILLYISFSPITCSTAYYLIRSPGRDKTIQATNTVFSTIPSPSCDGIAIYSALTPEYTSTFNPQQIRQYLFGPALISPIPGSSCYTTEQFLLIQGNALVNRDPRALLADYFYLPGTYTGQLFINPCITNKIINADIFVELDTLVPFMYGRLYAPLVWTRWNLNACEIQQDFSPIAQPAGYFTPGILPPAALLRSFFDYGQGCAPQSTAGILNDVSPPITGAAVNFEGLAYAQIPQQADTKVGLADVRIEVGYTLAYTPYCHGAINMQCAVPTSGTVRAKSLFDARTGNNNWELGAGCFGHYIIAESPSGTFRCTLYGDANLTHLFSGVQYRTHDLVDSPLSRYMLAIKMGTSITDNLMGTDSSGTNIQIPTTQFKNSIAPLANISTFPVRVSVALQADIIVLLHTQWTDSWAFEIGYNFWARSKEHIHITTDTFLRIEQELWAIKGDARMFGFLSDTSSFPHHAVPLSAAESRATIFSGTNKSSNLSNPNQNITAPLLATALSQEPLLIEPVPVTADQINTSINPHILTLADFDTRGAARALSHKIVSSLSYNAHCMQEYTFSLTLGGFAEFASSLSSSSHDFNKLGVQRSSALSQWSVFLKCGITFASSSY